MGLDMYLVGNKSTSYKAEVMEDGFPVMATQLKLGYWRKHPNLHGFIVQQFADGEDNCQEIYLSKDDLLKIIQAVKDDNLPYTEGFFFGASATKDDEYYLEEKNGTIEIFEKALAWIEASHDVSCYRDVHYRASW
jgi:hypothetical protein